jgi:virulence factor Mce-like protein
MRRLATALVLVAVGVAAVFALGASNGPSSPQYWVELDNAFGLVKGGDFKVAGVRAGKITDLKLNRSTMRALVQVQVNQGGFGSLRTDVHCDSRPQSLIGEYFLDCQPGTSPTLLKPNSVVPVTHTTSTIGPDLVNDVLRDPYRERLRIILNELGAGVAGNAQNLNDAIRRAVPALRETDQVLNILGQQDHILANLATEGNQVVSALAANKSDVQRFVVQANNAASTSAQRKPDIAAGIRKLPGFLAQLQPAMAALGQVADQQTPALQNLNASAGQLKTFLDQLGPFANASTPAFSALGKASQVGNQAVIAATPTVAQLNQFTQAGCPLPPNTPSGTPPCGVQELSKNFSTILQHLDNRQFAAEPDPRSPGGQGYTGLEALLNYFFYQTTSVNAFDSNEHMLQVAPFVSDCAAYEDAQAVRDALAGKNSLKHCIAALGPTQPGITTPDPTATATPAAHTRKTTAAKQAPAVAAPAPATSAPAAPSQPPSVGGVKLPSLPGVLNGVGSTLNKALQNVPQVSVPNAVNNTLNTVGGGTTTGTSNQSGSRSQKTLLNYLLAP